ncbi:MAG TPA: choice-of-anchor tandem repeat GloVer-containing protein, partial [Verrucomicrobiae bacterium]|nr:choice-of-anchor tandem repeat GloVer-containing protein [Verrucomicrobiae bacterium]
MILLGLGGVICAGTSLLAQTNIAIQEIYPFSSGGVNGASPYCTLAQGTDGNFYGTAKTGGADGYGTVFKLVIGPPAYLTNVVSFTGANGANPAAGLVQDANGLFYGTTSSGGAHSDGTVFSYSTNGTLTSMVSFTGTSG